MQNFEKRSIKYNSESYFGSSKNQIIKKFRLKSNQVFNVLVLVLFWCNNELVEPSPPLVPRHTEQGCISGKSMALGVPKIFDWKGSNLNFGSEPQVIGY